MKKTIRMLAVLIALLLTVSVCPVAIASAAVRQEAVYPFEPDLTKAAYGKPDAALTLNSETEGFDFSTIHDYLLEQLGSCATSISLSSYQIPRDQAQALVNYIGNEIPEAFHVNYAFSVRSSGGYLYDLTNITYRCTPAEYAAKMVQFRQNAAWLLRDLSAPALTDVEKALLIHDRLVTWTFYGFCGSEATGSPCYTVEGPLLMHEGVCSGYARLYGYLLKQVGIESQYVESDSLNHAWNMVKINGDWYHVDTTWDDGGWSDVAGRVFHENFLRSTNGIRDTGHTADDFITVPVSTAYDSAYWQDSIAEFVWFQSALYYIDSMTGKLYQRNGGAAQAVLSLSGSWGGWAILKKAESLNDERITSFYCLSANSRHLYYSTQNRVLQFDPSDLSSAAVYAPTLDSGSLIYGSHIKDWTLTVQIGTDPITITQTEELELVHEYTVAYDANGGSGAPEPQTKGSGQVLTLRLTTPTRDAYLFAGWNSKADGTGTGYQPGDPYTADEDVTLYAQWRREPPVISPMAGGVLIDRATQIIYGLPLGAAVENCLAVSSGSLAITYSNPNRIAGTGTTVNVYDDDHILADSYTVVVFGDVNGDGRYDGTDAYFTGLIANGMIPLSALSNAQQTAADANHDSLIDAADAKLMEHAGLLLESVDQSPNSEDVTIDSVYLAYCSLIDQTGGGTVLVEEQTPTQDQPAAHTALGWLRAVFSMILNLLRGGAKA